MQKLLSLLVIVFLISGCSSNPVQRNVVLNPEFFNSKQKLGVYVSPVPKITTSFPGAGCLLCLGVASAANSGLTKQVETFKAKELGKVKDNILASLREKGVEVVVIDKLIPENKLPKIKPGVGSTISRNYAGYKKQYGIDQLLIVNYTQVGVNRDYSSYVPVGSPYATITGRFDMIDINNNTYTLYDPLAIRKGEDGEDKSPNYPKATNAFYQAEEAAVDQLLKPFK